jgi:dTDP-glucose 4,6-dehydratase
VTGGAGFIGSHFVRHALAGGADVVNLDALTYAGDLVRLGPIDESTGYEFRHECVTTMGAASAIDEAKPDVVVHFAAESHVTRSERDPRRFHRVNVEGTRRLLTAADRAAVDLFVHVSTDEVYGPTPSGAVGEDDELAAARRRGNAYARSKAMADALARSFSDRLSIIVVRPVNVFGPYQLPEKAIARWITRGLSGHTLPVWGDGRHIRQWLHVDDVIAALEVLLDGGIRGHAYNISPGEGHDIHNFTMASWIAESLGLDPDRVHLTAYDRPHHDRRYASNGDKIRDLGWEAGDLRAQLALTVDWYAANEMWWRPHARHTETLYGSRS